VKALLTKIYLGFSSFGLSSLLFLFLFLLTVIGTLEQESIGLFEAQKKYFESYFVVYHIGKYISIPLPGVYLLLILLTINMGLGTIKRVPFKLKKIGIWITHGGILMLLAGSFVTFHFSQDGQMTLAEGQQSNEFISYHQWELAIIQTNLKNGDLEFLLPEKYFIAANPENPVTIKNKKIPFKIKILQYFRNAIIKPVPTENFVHSTKVREFYIHELSLDKENERNRSAALVEFIYYDQTQTGLPQKEILWGNSFKHPLTLQKQNSSWAIYLRKITRLAPFTVQLISVKKDVHPSTNTPKAFKSIIHKIEENSTQTIEIYMNHPLRHKGYTFFQSGYNEDPETGAKLSTFAVVNNPTDRFPEYACYVITFGLLVQFLTTLNNYLKSLKDSR